MACSPHRTAFPRAIHDLEVSMPLEEALDLAWRTLAECFAPVELWNC